MYVFLFNETLRILLAEIQTLKLIDSLYPAEDRGNIIWVMSISLDSEFQNMNW